MSDLVMDIMKSVYHAEHEPNHTLVFKVSYPAFTRLRVEADRQWLTGNVGRVGYEIAGVPLLIDPSSDEETWELLSVEPARLWDKP